MSWRLLQVPPTLPNNTFLAPVTETDLKKTSPRFVSSPHHRGFNNTNNFISNLKSHLEVFHTKWNCKTAQKKNYLPEALLEKPKVIISWRCAFCILYYYFLKCMYSADDVTAQGSLKLKKEKNLIKKIPHWESNTLTSYVLGLQTQLQVPAPWAAEPPSQRAGSHRWRSGRCRGRGQTGPALGSTAEGRAGAAATAPPGNVPADSSAASPSRSRSWKQEKEGVKSWDGTPRSLSVYPAPLEEQGKGTCHWGKRETHPHCNEISTSGLVLTLRRQSLAGARPGT